MRALMRSLIPTSFDDVAALVALYRPGPMAANMHNDYADRKNARKPITYLHPDMEGLLSDTYGLMIYQESVMRVAQKFAGYTLEEADNLRKACGKKIRELMAKEREAFVGGVRADRLHRRRSAPPLFDIIEPFADYAFPKAHAYGYGLVAYQTAWLKVHYPVEYLAALLTSVKDDKDRTAVYLAECRLLGIEVAGARRQLLGRGVHAARRRRRAEHRLRPGGRAQRGREPRRAHGGRAPGERRLRRRLRLLPARRPHRLEQADHGVAGQGGSLRLPRPSPPGACARDRRDRRPHHRAPARARRRHRHPVLLGRARGGARGRGPLGGHARSPSPTPSSTRRSAWPSRRRCSAST